MVPMLGPVVPPQPILLLTITPAIVGVVAALLAAVAIAVAGTLRELERGAPGAPPALRTTSAAGGAPPARRGVDAARARA